MTMYLQLHSDSFLVFVLIFFWKGQGKAKKKICHFFYSDISL